MDKTQYSVKEVVCDYGIYENGKLIMILNDRENALLIKKILEEDSVHKRYELTVEGEE